MMNKMDRIAQRARTGQEDAQILWQAGAEREMLEEFSQWIVRRSAFNPIV